MNKTATDTNDDIAALFDIVARHGVSRVHLFFHGQNAYTELDHYCYTKDGEEFDLDRHLDHEEYDNLLERLYGLVNDLLMYPENGLGVYERYEGDIILDVAKREISLNEWCKKTRVVEYR